MRRFASVNFHKDVKVPNSESPVSGCHAIGNLANPKGLVLEYDEEYGYVRVTAIAPRTVRDLPRCIPRENISDFVLLEDMPQPKKEEKKP